MTHECDISQENNRPFNDLAVVFPITPLEDIVKAMAEIMDESRLVNFVKGLGRDSISRLTYLPPIDHEKLPYGGVMYLNQLSHAHISSFDMRSAEFLVSLAAYFLNVVDLKITNHLLMT